MGVPSFNVHNENTVVGRQALEHEQHNMYRRILGAKSQVSQRRRQQQLTRTPGIVDDTSTCNSLHNFASPKT
jgi:hypothetical protein